MEEEDCGVLPKQGHLKNSIN